MLLKYYKNKNTGAGPFTAQDFGYSYMSQEMIEQLGLEEVDATYQPMLSAAEVKQQKLRALQDEYNDDVNQLKNRIAAAMLESGTQATKVSAAQSEFTTRKAQYAADRKAIINS